MRESRGPVSALLAASAARAAAHDAFLRFAERSTALQLSLLAQQHGLAALLGKAVPSPVAFDRGACLEFARGSLARVLGPDFAAVDGHPSRVRLPDEPLMLVDRIVSVEGEKGRLGPGRCVTEHDVHPAAWYLDGGRVPVCISVEAGQADLFLSAYLGIDHETLGHRVYRLLDAQIVFHRDLPRAGETLRYDIRIDRFIRQADTWLFFFRFDGTIDGAPFITMSDGCAGFFSKAQLEEGRGIVGEPASAPRARRRDGEGRDAAPFTLLAPPTTTPEGYDDDALAAFRRGDLAACFGEAFRGRALASALHLPDGAMRLIHRVPHVDTAGGRFGLGTVLGEADVHPDDWYLTCHFEGDPVMPGTLMYECCLHTLRFLLARLGLCPAETGRDVHCDVVPGVASRLRCRGQVTPGTRTVQYRIDIKEIGYGPEPYVLADASMFADGRHVVEMETMSLRIAGVTRDDVEGVWSQRPLFDRDRVLAYAIGKPSVAFGPPYAIFDGEGEGCRKLARLPGPPFLFVDRVVSCEPPPWVLEPGGWVTCAYDVPDHAWYFGAHRQPTMPFSVLLEAALQPCGWLAAYLGSALTRDDDLHFRNLDGAATVHAEVTPDMGTLTARARLTKTSQAGGMILQSFDIEVRAGAVAVYSGTTGFGFFPAQALAEQVGLRGVDPWPGVGRSFPLPTLAPLSPGDAPPPRVPGLSLPGRALSMIDTVERFELDGGPNGLGLVVGTKRVDPAEWFFAAHFLGDPVMPGSLGLEALTTLLKVYALERFSKCMGSHRFQTLAVGRTHRWTYRGQVVPKAKLVRVEARITKVEDGPAPVVVADGFLWVDQKPIYGMKDFALRLVPAGGGR